VYTNPLALSVSPMLNVYGTTLSNVLRLMALVGAPVKLLRGQFKWNMQDIRAMLSGYFYMDG
jgi:hypothetical protein